MRPNTDVAASTGLSTPAPLMPPSRAQMTLFLGPFSWDTGNVEWPLRCRVAARWRSATRNWDEKEFSVASRRTDGGEKTVGRAGLLDNRIQDRTQRIDRLSE